MKLSRLCLVATFLGVATSAAAKDIPVQMLTSGPGGAMVFSPAVVKANVGDTIRFIASPSHNAELIPGLVPAGVPISGGKMNQGFDLKVTAAGLYGIKCKPHFAMGMVALIKVGKGPAPNAASAAAVKLPGLAAKRMAGYLTKAK
ncbi:pseudoazurin [Sphingomonas kaistensis]|uniref:Pseudoazurin n=1 Tax=Sphingomonas kaistensis TaxID=298708 RepID=A0ABZ2G5Y5_9SPHN